MKASYIQLPPTWHQRSQTFWLGLPGAFWTVSTMCGASEMERMDCNNIGRVVSRFSRSGSMCIFKSHVYVKEARCVHPVFKVPPELFSQLWPLSVYLHIKHKRSAKKKNLPEALHCLFFFFPCASTVTWGNLGDKSLQEQHQNMSQRGFRCKQNVNDLKHTVTRQGTFQNICLVYEWVSE